MTPYMSHVFHIPDDISKERLAELIQYELRPDRTMYAGRKFFTQLLNDRGVRGVIDFVNRASVILDKQQELELSDFNDNGELEAFRKASVRKMSRRHFFGVVAEGFGGAALAAYGFTGMGHQATELAEGKSLLKEHEDGTTAFKRAQHALDDTVMPTAYAAIGSGMMYTAVRHHQEIKLSDIANAIGRLSDRLEEEKARTGGASR